MLDGTKILSETVTDAAYGNSYTLYYVYDANGSITGLHYNGAPYYFQKNIQGDVLRICNAAGAVVVEYTYDAWGNILSVTGSLASSLGQYNPFRYRGYYYDSETDLYYLNSRYYDVGVGRFINADGIVGANGGILGYNMFAYCSNNPVIYSDPSGYEVAYDLDPLSDKTERGELLGPSGGGRGGTAYYNYLVRSNCAAYDAALGGYHSNNVSSVSNNPGAYIVKGAVSITDDMATDASNPSQATNNKITTYQAPPGGGGVTTTVTIDNITVTFGHGGRHLVSGTDISKVEEAIARDIISRCTTAQFVPNVEIEFLNVKYVYNYYVRSSNLINVGTYHAVVNGE